MLNAQPDTSTEAEIVGQAGQPGTVTIATNMAGRGTDIKPDRDGRRRRRLHVIGTERHESLRIDRQLLGRAGRQGDPGSSQFFLSLEDELLEGLGPARQEGAEGARPARRRGELDELSARCSGMAQRRVERRHYIAAAWT